MRRPSPVMKMWVAVVGVVVVGLSMLAADDAWGGAEISLAPAVVELVATPGQAVTRQITVANTGTLPYQVIGYAWDMWHDGAQRRYAPPGTFPRSVAPRTAIVPATFALQPGKQQKVQITVDLPADETGGHYAVVFFEMAPLAGDATPTGGATLTVIGRLGASVLVNAGGAPVHASRVETLGVTPPSASAPLHVRLELLNPNIVHVRPRASVLVLRGRQPIGRFAAAPVLLLPGQRGILEGEWAGALAPGDYTLHFTVVTADRLLETLTHDFRVD